MSKSVASKIRIAARPAFSNEDTNPYNSLLYRAVAAADQAQVSEHRYSMLPWSHDVFHLHWPEFDMMPRSNRPLDLLKKVAVWGWLLAARLCGVKVVWTAHNSFGHDKKPSRFNLFLWRRFLSLLDGVIFLSAESRKIITDEYPALLRVSSAIVKHGHYRPWIDAVRSSGKAPGAAVSAAMDKLEGKFVILNFGQMRPYKNVEELMRQFSTLPDPDLRLLVAGGVPDASYLGLLSQLAAADSRIVLVPQHLDDPSLVACLDRADVIVLPYRKILNSGSALMALSLGKHVVVPAIGSMRSLQDDVGSGAVTLFEGDFDADVLRSAVSDIRMGHAEAPDMAEYEWPRLGAQMVEFYRKITLAK